METLIIKVQADIAGEDAQILWDKARQEVELNHRRNNPNLYQSEKEKHFENYLKGWATVTPDIPIIPKQEKVNDDFVRDYYNAVTQTIDEQIYSCISIKTLESYKFIVKGKKELEDIYNAKLRELQ